MKQTKIRSHVYIRTGFKPEDGELWPRWLASPVYMPGPLKLADSFDASVGREWES